MKDTLRRIALSIITVATVIYGGYIAPQLHNDFLRWKTEDSIVRVLIPSGRGGGTGFSMEAESGKKFIVTNKHVCEGAENGWMLIKNDAKKEDAIFKRVIYKDNIHDLCLIEGDDRFPALSIGKALELGQFNYIIGHPGLRNLTVSQGEYIGPAEVQLSQKVKTREECPGEVIEIDNPFIRIITGLEFVCLKSFKSLGLTTVAYPGNSGSPVVNRYGQVVGVLFAGSSEQERDNYAVPVEHLKRVLNKF